VAASVAVSSDDEQPASTSAETATLALIAARRFLLSMCTFPF
jgi:hypothetical protein